MAVVTALPEELAPIRARLGGREGVVLACTGDGRKNAARGIAEVLDRVSPSLLIGAGIAGALSPELAEGEVVVAKAVRAEERPGEDVGAPDPDWLARAERCGARAATLLTACRVVPRASDKARLYALLGARDVAATDVESAEWARAAVRRGVPFLVLRGVFDRAADDLPAYLVRAADGDGHVSRSGVAAYAALHPWVVPELLGMARRVTRVCERLAQVLEDLLR